MARTDIGETIYALRSELDLTTSEFAELVGVDKSSISRMEAGQSNPTVGFLLSVSRNTDVPFEDLMRVLLS